MSFGHTEVHMLIEFDEVFFSG